MRVLPHVDDVGVSPGSVIAWAALRRAGVVRSASLMVPCAWYPMARDDVLAEPDQDMGVHITLTSEWSAYRWRPMIGARGGLVDSEGYMHRRPEMVLAEADEGAVAAEIEAQIQQVLADGIRPTHLDAHMGTALLPPFVWALIGAGRRHGIPVLCARDMGPLVDIVKLPGFDAGYLREVEAEVSAAGWPVFDRFLIEFCPEGVEAAEHYGRVVSEGAPGGLNYLAMHADTGEGLQHFAPHHEAPRRKEYELFRNAGSEAVFGNADIVDWRQL